MSAVPGEGEVRALLRDLVTDLNAYNAGDMLEGYLDPLAAEYNARLEAAGLPTLDTIDKVTLQPVHSSLPDCFVVMRGGDALGDIERLTDGTWVGDVTLGNGPPSKPYATQDEAVAYVVDGWRTS